MTQMIKFRYKGKYVRIMHNKVSGDLAWFAYGVGMQFQQVADFWSVVLMDQITETIDRYLDDQEV